MIEFYIWDIFELIIGYFILYFLMKTLYIKSNHHKKLIERIENLEKQIEDLKKQP